MALCPAATQQRIGCSEKVFKIRSFKRYAPCVPRHVPSWLRNTEGTPQGTSTLDAFSETPFLNALCVRKRSVSKVVCIGNQAHIPRHVPFCLQNRKGIPLGTLTRNASSGTPFPSTREELLLCLAHSACRSSWLPRLAAQSAGARTRRIGRIHALQLPEVSSFLYRLQDKTMASTTMNIYLHST